MASLDYAVNRSYSSGQGRFTSVDPIGLKSASITNPQSNNLYAYVGNNPIDFVDPSGLLKLARKRKPIGFYGPSAADEGNFDWLIDPGFDDDDFGGGGGGGSELVPEKEKCKVWMVSSDGQTLTPGLEGGIPPVDKIGPQSTLGSNTGPNLIGYTFQAVATFSGNSKDYTIVQSNFHAMLTYDAAGKEIFQSDDPYGFNDHDGPLDQFTQKFEHAITYVDTPSLSQYRTNPIYNGYYVMNGKTTVTNKDKSDTCSAKWSWLLLIKDGKVVRNEFFNGRYISSFDGNGGVTFAP